MQRTCVEQCRSLNSMQGSKEAGHGGPVVCNRVGWENGEWTRLGNWDNIMKTKADFD